jgi:hypothetical protein
MEEQVDCSVFWSVILNLTVLKVFPNLAASHVEKYIEENVLYSLNYFFLKNREYLFQFRGGKSLLGCGIVCLK